MFKKLFALIAVALLVCSADSANAWGGRLFGRCNSCQSNYGCYFNNYCTGNSCRTATGYSYANVSGKYCPNGACPIATPAPCDQVEAVEAPTPCEAVEAVENVEETAPCEAVEKIDEPTCTPCGAVQITKSSLPVLCKDGKCRIAKLPTRVASVTTHALFNAINRVRARALAFDARLQAQAQYQANRMAATGRIFHSGYGWEICAQTWTDTDAVNEWYTSKMGHKEIMLGNFSRCGAASASDRYGRVWSCARFE